MTEQQPAMQYKNWGKPLYRKNCNKHRKFIHTQQYQRLTVTRAKVQLRKYCDTVNINVAVVYRFKPTYLHYFACNFRLVLMMSTWQQTLSMTTGSALKRVRVEQRTISLTSCNKTELQQTVQLIQGTMCVREVGVTFLLLFHQRR